MKKRNRMKEYQNTKISFHTVQRYDQLEIKDSENNIHLDVSTAYSEADSDAYIILIR